MRRGLRRWRSSRPGAGAALLDERTCAERASGRLCARLLLLSWIPLVIRQVYIMDNVDAVDVDVEDVRGSQTRGQSGRGDDRSQPVRRVARGVRANAWTTRGSTPKSSSIKSAARPSLHDRIATGRINRRECVLTGHSNTPKRGLIAPARGGGAARAVDNRMAV
jgi:hypothetical protein